MINMIFILLAIAALTVIFYEFTEAYPHLVKTEHDPNAFEHHDAHDDPTPNDAFGWYTAVMLRKWSE